uniref:NADH-ubiquinone oxidoreductase chain 3 n=1 Tax=Proales similis TaxID=360698 RepID=A0A7D4XFS7_9BILA|nr:NADH dehydrogenase subunit 3 [Proales similis]
MTLLILLTAISSVLVVVLKLVSLLISEKVIINREELTPFECGFEHHNNSRVPFSLRYFFLTLLFLLFDLEIILLIFIPYFSFSTYSLLVLSVAIFFLFILLLSLIYEWNDGTLEWIN